MVAALGKKDYEVGGEIYKKTPKGVPAEHPRAALLKHGGLHSGWEGKHPKELGSARFLDFVMEHFSAVAPLHHWLSSMTK